MKIHQLQLIATDPGEPSLEPPDEFMRDHVIGVGVPVLESIAEVGDGLLGSVRSRRT
jgi:hypothetical protein